MITLFEGYLAGMLAGAFGSLRDRRFFALVFFYAVMIISAHFYLVPTAKLLGAGFYLGAGAAQVLIFISCLLIRTKASALIGLLAYVAVIVNAIAYGNYPSQGGIHNYYFALINTVQTLQVAGLIVLSPMSLYFIGLATGRVKVRTKEPPWIQYRSET